MDKNNRFYLFSMKFLRRLLYANLIGFASGSIISGSNVITYWNIYLVYSSTIGMLLWVGIEQFSLYLDRKYSWLEFPVRKVIMRFSFSLIYSTIVMIILYMSIWFFINKRTNLNHFFEYNRFSFLIFYSCTIIIMLIFNSIGFFRAWQRTALNEERLKKESIAFQLQALRNQVDPHFLFNSLNTLTSLIETDTQKATTFVKQLSDMFRYMLDRSEKELVVIESELNFMQAYVFLQQMRFGDNLKVNVDIGDKHFSILPITLQMLIENAIKHNEISVEFPLTVSVFDDETYVVVKNTIQPKMLETPSKGIGLENLQVRYKFFTDKEVVIGCVGGEFFVKIPKLKI
jgi:two-component system, LytTR family, sensor kinase